MSQYYFEGMGEYDVGVDVVDIFEFVLYFLVEFDSAVFVCVKGIVTYALVSVAVEDALLG